ncbi:MAG: Immunity protein 41 [Pseudomonadota bacterium]
MNAIDILNRNQPRDENFLQSFYYKLIDENTWDIDEYFQLEWAILEITKNEIYYHNLYKLLFDIYNLVSGTFNYMNINKKVYMPINIENKKMGLEYKHRLYQVVRYYFHKIKLSDISNYNLDSAIINPYLK